MTRNFSKLMTDTKPQEAHRTSSRVNAQTDRQTKKLRAVDITFKLKKSKTKKKILERSSGGALFIEKQKTRIIPILLRKQEGRGQEQSILKC